MELYDIHDVLELIKGRLSLAGTQKALAEQWGISAPYLADVLAGKRDPGDKILRNLGLMKTLKYIRSRQPKKAKARA